jgi:plastocyanin/DNA/RNA endonuclease YhcR with UshA esterase domain
MCTVVAFSQIVINEIMYNPPESGTDSTEFIEIYNAGTDAVDLDGYHFTAGVEDTVSGVTLGPGEYYVFTESASAMMNVFGIAADQWTDGALGNGGELIALADASGNLVDMVEYDDGGDWVDTPDGDGPSLELISPEMDNNQPASWQASFTATGIFVNSNEIFATPGAANSINTGGPAVMIEAKNLKFIPDFALIKKGDAIRWFNNEAVSHNVNGQQSTYPDNPASFFSGVASAGPWEFDFTFDVDGSYDYQCDPHIGVGMVGTVAVHDPNGYTPFNYDQIKSNQNVQIITLFDGVNTQLTGIVHGINYNPSGYSFYLLNDNNEGINVFSFDPVSNYTVTEGDEITVWGQIDQFRGLIEIFPDSIALLSTGNPLLVAEEVSEISEEHESSFIKLTGVTVDSIGPIGSSGTDVYVSKGGVSNLVRIDSDTDIDVETLPAGALNITGLATQHDFDAPYDSDYQLLPRSSADIEGVSGITILERDQIQMYPNPVLDNLILQSELTMEKITISSLDGSVIKQMEGSFLKNRIAIDRLNAGMYTVQVLTTEGVWMSTFVKM